MGVKVCGVGGWDLLFICWFVGLWVWVVCAGGWGVVALVVVMIG